MLNSKSGPFLLIIFLFGFITSCKDSSIDESYSLSEMIKFEKSFTGLSQKFTKSTQIIASSRVEDECIENSAANCITYLNLPLHHLYLPQYDCFVNASCSIIMCYLVNSAGGLDLQIYFKNFYVYYDNESDCSEIKQYWAQLKSERRLVELDESIADFRDYIADIFLAKFMNDFFKPDLGRYFECGSINNTLYVNYVKNVCYKFCVKDILIGGEPGLEVDNSTRNCGTACCKQTSQYCIEDGEYIISDPVFTKIGTCTNEATTSCPIEYSQIEIECSHGCSR